MDPGTVHWLQFISQGAANVLVSGTWEGFVLALGIGLLLRLLPKVSASTRFTIWTAVFLSLALLPFIHVRHSVQGGAAISASASLFHLDMRWSFAIAALWVISSLYRASSLALHGFRLRALWRRSTPIDAGAVSGPLLTGAGNRGLQLCTSEDLDQPSVIGFFSPRILIPAWLFGKLTPIELEQIVLHEVEHLRRGDDWINLAQKLGLVLFPLNPVLVWIEKRLCFERELACDDGVVRATRAPRAYATCLTNLAEQSLDRRAAALTLGAWGRRSAIAGRVHTLLRRGDILSPRQARGVTWAAMLGLLVGTLGLSQCPQLVSFSVPARSSQTLAEVHPDSSHRSDMALNVSLQASRVPGSTLVPRATFLKASLPPHGVMRPTGPPVVKRAVRATESRGMANIHHGTRYWLVLTSWPNSGNQERMQPSMIEEPALSPYAAVPTEDGWIIIQL